MTRRRLPAALSIGLAALCGAVAFAAPARGATYTVLSCDAAPFGVDRAWQPRRAPQWRVVRRCPSDGHVARGLYVGTGGGTLAGGSHAGWRFAAPRRTTIAGGSFAFRASIPSRSHAYAVRLVNQRGVPLFACAGARRCRGASRGRPRYLRAPRGTTELRWQVVCHGGRAGCRPGAGRPSLGIYYAAVTVRDSTPPRVRAGGGLWSAGWHRGTQSARFDALDASGVRRVELAVDRGGRDRRDLRRHCDFTRVAPCPQIRSASLALGTRSLSDGAHVVKLSATDAAGNTRVARRRIAVDNAAPEQLSGAYVVGGTGWRRHDRFDVRWVNPPGQVAPIVRAHYRICRAGGTSRCVVGVRSGRGIASLPGLSVPAVGDWVVRVWLEDEAGNRDPQAASVGLRLRFDDTVPGEARPQYRNGWINAVEFTEPISLTTPNAYPPSGIAGYSVTTHGSDPDDTPEAGPDGLYRAVDLPEGVVTIKARAISGSGVPATRVGSTQLHIDRTPPSIAAGGAPDPEIWQRGPVTLQLQGTDQPNLSGMAAAPPDHSVESGGYLAYAVDGGPVQKVRGATADVTVGGDGRHTVVLHAVDVAGNASPDRTVSFEVDATPPETIAFRPQDPNDPRKVEATVADRTSGVAGGVIELRRVDRGDPWTSLATHRVDGRLVAHVDDGRLADGYYELRARARDVAGNEGVGYGRADGSRAVLRVPLRIPTRIRVATPTRVIRRCHRRRHHRVCHRRTVHGSRDARHPARVAFGRSVDVRGSLHSVAGRPVAGVRIEVVERVRAVGIKRHVASVTTRRDGRFAYRAPEGPSRALAFRYAGTSVLRPSAGAVAVRVPAHSSLRARPRRLRNGHRVRFSGRLAGGFIPSGGKAIELQAKVRRRWRTFATVVTDAHGRWHDRYRFTVTNYTTRYHFRVRIRGEADYPYTSSASSPIGVTVLGG